MHERTDVWALKLFKMLCPECRLGTCRIVNLSRKYETLLASVDTELLLPSTELGILQTLHDERSPQFAQDIAAELDCSYQLVGKRAKNLADRGLVIRDMNSEKRRTFNITQEAETAYFNIGEDDGLDVAD